jgi:hypothetical protein
MSLTNVFGWLENLPYATAIRESGWLFPTIETTHVIALTMVVGSIGMMDLRLLGVSSRDRAVSEVSAQVLPYTWASFVLAAITGFLLFSSAAVRYWGLYTFRAKMCLLLLAGVNMMVFHVMTYKTVKHWDNQVRTPRAARIAGALSLLLWIGVVVCGRWLGFLGQETPPS